MGATNNLTPKMYVGRCKITTRLECHVESVRNHDRFRKFISQTKTIENELVFLFSVDRQIRLDECLSEKLLVDSRQPFGGCSFQSIISQSASASGSIDFFGRFLTRGSADSSSEAVLFLPLHAGNDRRKRYET